MEIAKLNSDRKFDRHRKTTLDTMVFGKVPPQAKELEKVVLGAILLEKSAFAVVSEILSVDSFYLETHQVIFSSMIALAGRDNPIDLLTVVEELRIMEKLDIVGGPFYIIKLTNEVQSAASIDYHSRIIQQRFLQREIIRIGGEMVTEAYEESTDVFELMDQIETNVFDLTQNHVKSDYNHISKGLVKVMKRLDQLRFMDESITGVPSSFEALDKTTHGWQPQDLIILAARPSVGKTAFALNLARNAALHPDKPTAVGFFSLEMSEQQLISRILSAETNIWLERFSTGKMSDDFIEILHKKGVDPLSSAPIYIDDSAALTLFELRSKARRMVNKHKVGLIIIDYLQLMETGEKTNNGNREREISKLSRELKKLAKQLDIPIIALSQLSREVEKRGKGQKQPQLSDLRESGAIEQDADLVMFLYRPPEDEVLEDAELRNTGSVKIAKHRNGALINIAFSVNNSVQQWKEKAVISAPPGFIRVSQANADQAMSRGMEGDEELPF